MKRQIGPLCRGKITLTAGMAVTAIGIGLYCVAQASAPAGIPGLLAPATGAGIIATGVLVWLKGAAELSLEL